MRKVQIAVCLLTAALATVSFTGCGETKTQAAGEASAVQEQQAPQNEKGTMAKVVSLDGDQLTVILADMPDGNRGGAPPANGTPPAVDGQPGNGAVPPGGSAPPDGNAPPDGAMPPGGGNGPAPASGSAVDSSGVPADQPGQGGQGGGKIQFTGEQSTYTLSSDVTVKKGIGDSAATIDLSELKANDVYLYNHNRQQRKQSNQFNRCYGIIN